MERISLLMVPQLVVIVLETPSSAMGFAILSQTDTRGGGNHCLTFYELLSCVFATSQVRNAFIGSGQCYHANTGGPVRSLKCLLSTTSLAWYVRYNIVVVILLTTLQSCLTD
ncbi:hypothetical protein CVT25_008935 [Psilocybe cyanescens]|uniref:Secreted protein n=1 Tax=Psilocybe cyanescens TaxID=93625 RepID=A0A409XN85_PSICY|nr:hypothetical protein CVT25_008935 [Psilocybe cyanescens]